MANRTFPGEKNTETLKSLIQEHISIEYGRYNLTSVEGTSEM